MKIQKMLRPVLMTVAVLACAGARAEWQWYWQGLKFVAQKIGPNGLQEFVAPDVSAISECEFTQWVKNIGLGALERYLTDERLFRVFNSDIVWQWELGDLSRGLFGPQLLIIRKRLHAVRFVATTPNLREKLKDLGLLPTVIDLIMRERDVQLAR